MDLDRLTEYELWKHLLDVLNACTNRNNTCAWAAPHAGASAGRLGLCCEGAVGAPCACAARWCWSAPARHAWLM